MTDYVLLPEWLLKFLPSTDAVFVQDDVLLVMRQHPPTKRALDTIEDKTLVPKIMELYGTSIIIKFTSAKDFIVIFAQRSPDCLSYPDRLTCARWTWATRGY